MNTKTYSSPIYIINNRDKLHGKAKEKQSRKNNVVIAFKIKFMVAKYVYILGIDV